MANPLYDALFGVHAGKPTPFLILRAGTIWTHADFLKTASQIAEVLVQSGLQPGDCLAASQPLPTLRVLIVKVFAKSSPWFGRNPG